MNFSNKLKLCAPKPARTQSPKTLPAITKKDNMKLTTLILGLVIALTSCGNGQSNKNDLNIPDKVEIKKEGKHQQFLGTRVFIVNPEGYLLLPSLIRFQKNNDTYIQAIESPKTSYTNQKSSIKQAFESGKSKGLNAYYQKEFKLGDYDAYLVYGADNKPNLDQMVLIFGDNDFAVMVAGELPSNDDKARQEVLSALLTTYLDKSVKPDYSALANFTLDVSKSEFKFNSNMSQIFYYTIDGQGDPVNNVFENQIMVMTLPSMESFDARKSYAQSMVQRYKNNGISIPTFEEKEVKINDVSAYEISFTGSFQGKSVKVYQVVLGDNKATLLFCGMTYDRQDELFKQYKDIAQTLKTK
jgi:hypothetical protein